MRSSFRAGIWVLFLAEGLLCVSTVAQAQVEIATIDISAAGEGKRMLLGDITGNGLLDVVMMQGDQMSDDRYIGHQVNCLTAYDWAGNLLWQVGNPAAGSSTGSDIPAQIYDIDDDGYNEVLACMDNDVVSRKFVVLDGQTGTIEGQYEYPSAEAHDTIVIANLSGSSHPSDIVLKDRYNNLWAMNRNWEVLFTHAGNLGHYPWASDYDNDGAEELMAGYDFLESDGQHVWSVNQGGHADCIWVGDIDENPENGKEIALGGEDITVYDKGGALLAREDAPIEPQNIAIGDFRPDLPGLEIGGQDRRDRGTPGEEAIFLWSPMQEEMLFYNVRSGWGSIANMVHNWDGMGSDFISVWRGPAAPSLFDGEGNEVVSFAEGYLMTGDVDGDGRSEVITFTEAQAILYSFSAIDLQQGASGTPRPQAKMQYNFTRYWGGEYPPFDSAVNPATGGTSGVGGISGQGGEAGSGVHGGAPGSGAAGGLGGAVSTGGGGSGGGSVGGTNAGGATGGGFGGITPTGGEPPVGGSVSSGGSGGAGGGPSGGGTLVGATGGRLVGGSPATGGTSVGGSPDPSTSAQGGTSGLSPNSDTDGSPRSDPGCGCATVGARSRPSPGRSTRLAELLAALAALCFARRWRRRPDGWLSRHRADRA